MSVSKSSDLITVTINGDSYQIPRDTLIIHLIEKRGLVDGKVPFAVAINQSILHQSAYHSTQLKMGDQIEILTPMAGG